MLSYSLIFASLLMDICRYHIFSYWGILLYLVIVLVLHHCRFPLYFSVRQYESAFFILFLLPLRCQLRALSCLRHNRSRVRLLHQNCLPLIRPIIIVKFRNVISSDIGVRHKSQFSSCKVITSIFLIDLPFHVLKYKNIIDDCLPYYPRPVL